MMCLKFSTLAILLLSCTDISVGKSLIANLMRQADTLKHGLELATKVGDLGSHRYDVAFTAYPSSSGSYSTSYRLPFNRVRVNHGNAFSTSTYRFTAPSDGLYVFVWSISGTTGKYANTKLMKDGSTYQQTYCYNVYQQCGTTVVIWLNKNNQVWLQPSSSSFYIYANWSTFSGWKIH